MRNTERLRALKSFIQENLCDGREMKAPGKNYDIREVRYTEPKCHIGWTPTRPDMDSDGSIMTACPGILIMPSQGNAYLPETRERDRADGVRRSKQFGDTLSVSILLAVYEPGIRMPGYMDENGVIDADLIKEGTEQGLMTLIDWMDDTVDVLMKYRSIPHTDLILNEETVIRSMYTEGGFVVDKRPVFYGFVNCEFKGHTSYAMNDVVADLLK